VAAEARPSTTLGRKVKRPVEQRRCDGGCIVRAEADQSSAESDLLDSQAGITVRLLWSRSTNLVTVAVDDAANDDYFELILDEHDRALDVFHHPFAHAAARGIEFRTGRPELLLDAA
jgi:hypothetical protein